MGNRIEVLLGNCPSCGLLNSCCNICNLPYCPSHDIHHGRGFVDFGTGISEESKRSVFNTHNGKLPCEGGIRMCPSPGCNSVGTLLCASLMCCSLFCPLHTNHSHLSCPYFNCPYLATIKCPIYGFASCKNHENLLDADKNKKYLEQAPSQHSQQYTTMRNYYGNCLTCKNPLTSDRASIKYCVDCNIKWIDLRNRGIKGPFG